MMNKLIIVLLTTLITSVGISAQKAVRSDIRKGNKAYNKELYNDAAKDYKNALQKNQSSKEATFNLGNAYYRTDQWDNALKQYEQYISLETQDSIRQSGTYHNIGNTYLKKITKQSNQPQAQDSNENQQKNDPLTQAISAYKEALRLNPKDDETRYNLAVAQRIQKDRQQKNNQNKNKNKDKNKKDKNKDKKKQDKKKDQKNNQKQDKKNNQKQNQDKGQNQMSKDNIQQILQAIQQDEQATQAKVQQLKAKEQKQKNNRNKQLNQDW